VTDDDARLEALRLADSFLPVGTNSVSYGLEQFAAEDRVTDADDLRGLLAALLRRQVGPADLVALRHAHRGARAGDLDTVCAADRRLAAATLAAEFRESARLAGGRLLSLQRDLTDDDLVARYAARVDADETPGGHPVVLGAVTARAGVDEREACLTCAHGFVTGLLGAGQRLLSVGHVDAQRVLRALRPVVTDAVDASADRSLDEVGGFAPLTEVVSAAHERADRRLFVS
jgi:urease accessory protein